MCFHPAHVLHGLYILISWSYAARLSLIICFVSPQCLSRSTAVEIVNSSKVLQAETKMLLDGKLLVRFCTFVHEFSSVCLSHFSLCCLIIVFVGFLFAVASRALVENTSVHSGLLCRRINIIKPEQSMKASFVIKCLSIFSLLLLSLSAFPLFCDVYKPFQM